MKGLLIFIILLVLCCTMNPAVPPSDIGDYFVGENGLMSKISNICYNVSNFTMNLISDPLGAVWDLISSIFDNFVEVIKNLFNIDSDYRPEVKPGSGDGHSGNGFEGGGDGFGGGMGSRP